MLAVPPLYRLYTASDGDTMDTFFQGLRSEEIHSRMRYIYLAVNVLSVTDVILTDPEVRSR